MIRKFLAAAFACAMLAGCATPAPAAVMILRVKGHNVIAISTCAGDGLAGAPSGTPQFATALNGITFRPGCAIPGVDYRVGPPEGQVFAAPSTLGADWNATLHRVSCDGETNKVIDGIDFASAGGTVYVRHNCNHLTIKNSKLRMAWGVTGSVAGDASCSTGVKQESDSTDIIFINDEFDGGGIAGAANCNNAPAGNGEIIQLNGAGVKTLDYVYIHDVNQHFLTFGGTGPTKELTGSLTGTDLNVTALDPTNPAPLAVGDTLSVCNSNCAGSATGTDAIMDATKIISQQSGTTGGVGHYTALSRYVGTQTVALREINVTPVVLNDLSLKHFVITRCGYGMGAHCNGLQWTGAQAASTTIQDGFFYDPQPDTASGTINVTYAISGNTFTWVDQGGVAITQGSSRVGVHCTGSGFTGTAQVTGTSGGGGATMTNAIDKTVTVNGAGTVNCSDMYPIGLVIGARYVNDGGASTLTNAIFKRLTFFGTGPIKEIGYAIDCDAVQTGLEISDLYWNPPDFTGSPFNIITTDNPPNHYACPGRTGNGAKSMADGTVTPVP